MYLNAALLAAILLVLVTRAQTPTLTSAAWAQTQLPIAGGAGLFVMPAQLSPSVWGCYVMDVDSQTLCAYQYSPGDKQLRLVAARNFRYDRQLGNFNTDPSPLEIKELVEKEQARTRGASGPE